MRSIYPEPTSAKPSISLLNDSLLIDYRRWCWGQILESAQHDIRSLRAHVGGRLVVLDMWDATAQRPDSHSIKIPSGSRSRCCDCMHHCLPGGPMETWNDGLFAAMRDEERGRWGRLNEAGMKHPGTSSVRELNASAT